MKLGKIVLENDSVIELKFYDDLAPKTVANFEKLANSGFYNGVLFHRVIPNFVSQGGDPTGSGAGNAGYTIDCETKGNTYKHIPGALSMAHRGPNTGSCQFFISHTELPHLDGVHTVFGVVTKGLEYAVNMKQGTKMKSVSVWDE